MPMKMLPAFYLKLGLDVLNIQIILTSSNGLTHWVRVMHICVSNLTITGSDNGLSPGRRQAIIQTNAAILSIGPLGTFFNEIFTKVHTFSFKKVHLKCHLENGGHLPSASMCWRERETLLHRLLKPASVLGHEQGNYIQVKQLDIITHPCLNFTGRLVNAVGVRVWMSNHIPHK